ncbi:hypothetical protein EDC14_102625 [Hydrogenispora ethanolica]|jgi:hypothetical protein|uniref:Uncharacterized protein n=1 Tax=Hydrogenispora ethanolica TaxID=1082276 RepID=A0A4R1RA64_HYDET|nr:hypothetical protein [Hydrogenispora ethanolica]TCL62282.1 hypothetical protein EDC14_102625 [Hydrogenispora ethanolica]
MNEDHEKIVMAKLVLEKIAGGVNPLTHEAIPQDSFLNEPKIIRCFYFVAEILDQVARGAYRSGGGKPAAAFVITPEQKQRLQFTPGKIGVNEFAKCVNLSLDLNQSKKLTGVELNKRLKKLGVLSEESGPDGKTRTITNQKSLDYGFESEKRSYNGAEYTMVVLNEKGKRYLLDNLESIMAMEV